MVSLLWLIAIGASTFNAVIAVGAAAATPPPATNCGAWQKGISLTGRDFDHQATPSAAACCELCGKTVGASQCTGWTWNLGDHHCWLKTDITSNRSSACVSGFIGPGPPLPVPPPAPSPPAPPPAYCSIDPPLQHADGTQFQCPWYNQSLSFATRRDALLSVLTVDEKLLILAQRGCGRLHVPSDGFNEALHGVAWAGRATVFPCPMSMAATWNTSLINEIGKAVAFEALAKHWRNHTNALSFFAPNINIVRDIRWGRAQETYGEDPTLTGAMGAAYVNGMQTPDPSWPVPAVRNVAKHFAAYNLESDFAGRTTASSIAKSNGQYRLSYDANVSDADLMQTFLPAFEDLVKDAKLRGVMCAYNSVNGTPLCANKLMQEQLRDRMGFEGIVITDCGAIGYMVGGHHWKHSNGSAYTPVQATAASLAAGTDLNCGGAYGGLLPEAYAQSMVSLEQIDQAAGRALYGHLELGLFQDTAAAATDPRRQVSMEVVDSAEHRELARQAAAEGVVLLKNINAALPLAGTGMTEPQLKVASGLMRLAVVGPNANRTDTLTSNYAGCKDGANGALLPECVFVNPLQGLSAAAKASAVIDSNVLYEQGVEIDTNSTTGIAAAVAAAKRADVVIMVGGLITCQETGEQCQEAEARDRSTPANKDGTLNPLSHTDIGFDYGIGLPGRQMDLLKALCSQTNATVVLVIMSGSSVATPWASASARVGAIIQHFYSGVLGGQALAEVIFGSVAPAGRLPVMVPVDETQLPKAYLDQRMSAEMGRTHRYFTGKPLYPFGFGLGYSSFTFSELSVSHGVLAAGQADVQTKFLVAVTVQNNGEFKAESAHVLMVFARPKLSQVATAEMSIPKQLLLAFTKVTIKADESQRVTIPVSAKQLRLMGADRQFGLQRGEYTLHVGGTGPGSAAGLPEPLRTVLRVD